MLQDKLNFYKDFPKEGINFIDIMPFLYSKDVFREVISELDALVDTPNLAVPEARGFLFGTPLLMTDGAVSNVIPVRKSGKLPFSEGDLVGVEIMKEYGADKLFYRKSDVAAGPLTDNVLEASLTTSSRQEVLPRRSRSRSSGSRTGSSCRCGSIFERILKIFVCHPECFGV